MSKLTGIEAIEYKKMNPYAELNKYNDPTEEERFDLTIEAAEEIASDDPSLLWVDTDAVTIVECDSELELYTHYDGQCNRQPCFIELDCREKTMAAQVNGEIGNAIPFSTWYGRDIRFAIPLMKGSTANALMEEIKPLAQRVLNGYDEKLNDQSNWIGILSDDAEAAKDEIEEICRNAEGDIECWECEDWLDEVTHISKCKTEVTIDIDSQLSINSETTDSELEDLEEKIDEFAIGEGIVLSGVDSYLKGLRDTATELS